MSDDRWVAIGLAVLFGAVSLTSLSGSNEAVLTAFFTGVAMLYRAITRPVGSTFVPEDGWLFWTAFSFGVAGVVAAIWLQSYFWLCVLFGASVVFLTASHLLKE